MKRMTMKTKSVLLLVVCLNLGACATNNNQIYHWGSYETLLYNMYNKPGKATPEIQIAEMNTDLQKATKPQPPGFYAHLGTMYAAAGNLSEALAAFELEKANFPESSILVDGMIKRATSTAGDAQ